MCFQSDAETEDRLHPIYSPATLISYTIYSIDLSDNPSMNDVKMTWVSDECENTSRNSPILISKRRPSQ
ncbi:hypothetical protein EYC84_004792 [Monilinia fructicola]|uniref:Uncharacterized protein n=1 Tax=Monilinia fructicola TaxID=38448 RepID=A0A5M9K9V2_MONFR|nr:hypothetical protein EYC84_004792 [Monilinia fructicola]